MRLLIAAFVLIVAVNTFAQRTMENNYEKIIAKWENVLDGFRPEVYRAMCEEGLMDSVRVSSRWYYRLTMPQIKKWKQDGTLVREPINHEDLVFLGGNDFVVYDSANAIDPDTLKITRLLFHPDFPPERVTSTLIKAGRSGTLAPVAQGIRGAFLSKAQREAKRPNERGPDQ